jgi:hypothetical protein
MNMGWYDLLTLVLVFSGIIGSILAGMFPGGRITTVIFLGLGVIGLLNATILALETEQSVYAVVFVPASIFIFGVMKSMLDSVFERFKYPHNKQLYLQW